MTKKIFSLFFIFLFSSSVCFANGFDRINSFLYSFSKDISMAIKVYSLQKDNVINNKLFCKDIIEYGDSNSQIIDEKQLSKLYSPCVAKVICIGLNGKQVGSRKWIFYFKRWIFCYKLPCCRK